MHLGFWAWVAVGLAGAGLLLGLASVLSVVPGLLRLRRRLFAISQSRFATSLAGLQAETERIGPIKQRAAGLTARVSVLRGDVEAAAGHVQMPEAQEALRDAGEQMRLLSEDLR